MSQSVQQTSNPNQSDSLHNSYTLNLHNIKTTRMIIKTNQTVQREHRTDAHKNIGFKVLAKVRHNKIYLFQKTHNRAKHNNFMYRNGGKETNFLSDS